MSSNDEVVHDTLLTKRKRSEDSISNGMNESNNRLIILHFYS